MGRFYNIVVSGAQGALANFPGWSSQSGGQDDPGALNVEFDIPVTSFAAPISMPFIRVWGVDLATISQSSNFNGASVQVFAGMSAGLPLAQPSQQGLIAQGLVFQALGNWVGVSMTLDLQVSADGRTWQKGQASNLNLVVDWKAGQTLASVITTALQTAFPGYTVNNQISGNIVLPNDDHMVFDNVYQLNDWAQDISRSVIKTPNYPGVGVTLSNKAFRLFDGTAPGAAKALAFNDFIGQPTWIEPYTVQFNCVMRADLTVGDLVTFPNQQTTSTAGELTLQAKDKSSFSGSFMITQLRHVGNFREPDGVFWVTTFNAVAQQVGS